MKKLTLYWQLGRFDKPIGIWLLLWPCLWGMGFASSIEFSDISKIIFFFIGAASMRAAGCIYNDIIDRDIDAKVERTKNRPLASKKVTIKEAWGVIICLCLIGLTALLTFNNKTILIAFLSIPLVLFYPYMKKIFFLPQLFLGVVFNWGIFVGWASMEGVFSPSLLCLYVAAILWTVIYDTFYAFQDIEDDKLLGVKSSARIFEDYPKYILTLLTIIFSISLGLVGSDQKFSLYYMTAISISTLGLGWLIYKTDLQSSQSCMKAFKINNFIGLIIFLGFLTGRF